MFEVFDSGGGWLFLFGKPMLWAFHALHDFRNDTVILVRDKKQAAVLTNQIDQPYYARLTTQGLWPALDWKQHKTNQEQTPAREVGEVQSAMVIEDNTEQAEREAQWTEIPTDQLGTKGELFTRQTEPFNPKQIEAIWRVVRLGNDLTDSKRDKVRRLIVTYANCFALSVHEVVPAKDTMLSLNIPNDVQLPKKACQ